MRTPPAMQMKPSAAKPSIIATREKKHRPNSDLRNTMTSCRATTVPLVEHSKSPACSVLTLNKIKPLSRVNRNSDAGSSMSRILLITPGTPMTSVEAGVKCHVTSGRLLVDVVAHPGGKSGKLQLRCSGAPDRISVLKVRWCSGNRRKTLQSVNQLMNLYF